MGHGSWGSIANKESLNLDFSSQFAVRSSSFMKEEGTYDSHYKPLLLLLSSILLSSIPPPAVVVSWRGCDDGALPLLGWSVGPVGRSTLLLLSFFNLSLTAVNTPRLSIGFLLTSARVAFRSFRSFLSRGK